MQAYRFAEDVLNPPPPPLIGLPPILPELLLPLPADVLPVPADVPLPGLTQKGHVIPTLNAL